jgi:hypothetical protein
METITRAYSNQISKKSIANKLVEDATPITIEGVEYYYCGTVDNKEVGDTLFRNKVLRAFTKVDNDRFVERIVLVG